jgi:hypothetical protein
MMETMIRTSRWRTQPWAAATFANASGVNGIVDPRINDIQAQPAVESNNKRAKAAGEGLAIVREKLWNSGRPKAPREGLLGPRRP